MARSLAYEPRGVELYTYANAARELSAEIEVAIRHREANGAARSAAVLDTLRDDSPMTAPEQQQVDEANAEFWAELCGSSLALLDRRRGRLREEFGAL